MFSTSNKNNSQGNTQQSNQIQDIDQLIKDYSSHFLSKYLIRPQVSRKSLLEQRNTAGKDLFSDTAQYKDHIEESTTIITMTKDCCEVCNCNIKGCQCKENAEKLKQQMSKHNPPILPPNTDSSVAHLDQLASDIAKSQNNAIKTIDGILGQEILGDPPMDIIPINLSSAGPSTSAQGANPRFGLLEHDNINTIENPQIFDDEYIISQQVEKDNEIHQQKEVGQGSIEISDNTVDIFFGLAENNTDNGTMNQPSQKKVDFHKSDTRDNHDFTKDKTNNVLPSTSSEAHSLSEDNPKNDTTYWLQLIDKDGITDPIQMISNTVTNELLAAYCHILSEKICSVKTEINDNLVETNSNVSKFLNQFSDKIDTLQYAVISMQKSLSMYESKQNEIATILKELILVISHNKAVEPVTNNISQPVDLESTFSKHIRNVIKKLELPFDDCIIEKIVSAVEKLFRGSNDNFCEWFKGHFASIGTIGSQQNNLYENFENPDYRSIYEMIVKNMSRDIMIRDAKEMRIPKTILKNSNGDKHNLLDQHQQKSLQDLDSHLNRLVMAADRAKTIDPSDQQKSN